MNIFFWILQVVLALHTATGAIWKFSNSEQAAFSLKVIPHPVWLGLSGIELLCAVGLIVPAFIPQISNLVPVSAAVIAVEMLVFCGIHLASGDGGYGPLIYWLVVAVLSAFLAYGRFVLSPL